MYTNAADERIRLLVEHMTDAVFEATIDGVITWISPSVERISGWLPDAVVGRNVNEFVDPSDVATSDALASRVGRGESVSFTGRCILPAGGFMWVSVSVAPLTNGSDPIVHSVGVVRNVDAIVRARLELAASEEHYRLLADHVAAGVVRLEPDLTITWVSPSIRHILGYEPEEVVCLLYTSPSPRD